MVSMLAESDCPSARDSLLHAAEKAGLGGLAWGLIILVVFFAAEELHCNQV